MSQDWNIYYGRNNYSSSPLPFSTLTSSTPFPPVEYAHSTEKPRSTVGDFSPFYISIAICSLILGSIIILNSICCCSKYRKYWVDRNTGNRWLVSLWTTTPHKQPPLDLTELEHQYIPAKIVVQSHSQQQDYIELQKRESDL